MDRVRINDTSGRVCADVDPAEVVAVHGNPEGHHVELLFRNGQRATLEPVVVHHVMDQLFPRADAG